MYEHVLISIEWLILMEYGFFQKVSQLRPYFSVPRVTVILGFHCICISDFIAMTWMAIREYTLANPILIIGTTKNIFFSPISYDSAFITLYLTIRLRNFVDSNNNAILTLLFSHIYYQLFPIIELVLLYQSEQVH